MRTLLEFINTGKLQNNPSLAELRFGGEFEIYNNRFRISPNNREKQAWEKLTTSNIDIISWLEELLNQIFKDINRKTMTYFIAGGTFGTKYKYTICFCNIINGHTSTFAWLPFNDENDWGFTTELRAGRYDKKSVKEIQDIIKIN